MRHGLEWGQKKHFERNLLVLIKARKKKVLAKNPQRHAALRLKIHKQVALLLCS
jgi:hypothetical protein